MARPTVSDTAERIYARLEPYAARDGYLDADTGWLLLHYCEALAITLRKPTDVLRHDDTGSGWRRMLDPARCPVWALPWLAQPVGSPPLIGLTEQQQRAVIRDAPGLRRGRLAAIVAAAQPTLTGARIVRVVERVGGDAYAITVITRTSETPDPAATEAAIRSQKPTGLVLDYFTSDAPLIDEGTRQIDAVTATIDAATLADVT